MKVDLGCGRMRQPGTIGIDIVDEPGVDIVSDLNKGIPLEDNSVEYLVSSHFLEHTDDLVTMMQEIYRVCKHGAIVCIAVPYYNTDLNLANPYHKQVFNENTPRFFTTNEYTVVDPDDYYFPSAITWALGESDNRDLKMDFRCVNMKIFYFPQYADLPEDQKRELRKSRRDVADQIVYHFVVVKEPGTTNEEVDAMRKELISQITIYQPTHVTIRELVDDIRRLSNTVSRVESEKQMISTEREQIYTSKNEMEIQLVNQHKEMQEWEIQKENELQQMQSKWEEDIKRGEAEHARSSLREYKRMQELKAFNDTLTQEVQKIAVEYNTLSSRTAWLDNNNNQLAETLHKTTNGRFYKLYNRLYQRYVRMLKKETIDISNNVATAYEYIRDASILDYPGKMPKCILTTSSFLQDFDMYSYTITPTQDVLCGIEALFFSANPSFCSNEQIALEILDQNDNILRSVPNTGKMTTEGIAKFQFEPIHGCTNQTFKIRFVLMAGQKSSITAIYEWQNISLFGKIKKRIFFGNMLYI